jgi:hypothetical protein
MTVEDVESGMVLHWQSERFPNKHSRWIVLEELKHQSDEQGKVFNIFCIYSNSQSTIINIPTSYSFHNENIHRFSIHSQI